MALKKRIAIDLGTANTVVWVAGEGIVANEPTVVAIAADDGRVIAVGEEAKLMLGRTPEALIASRPMRDGVIADYQVTREMLKYFIQGAITKKFGIMKFLSKIQLFGPDVMICVPAGCTQVERRAALDATLSAGASHAYLIDEPLAAAIGAGIPVSAPSGHMIIDIGGGSSEAAVISLGGVVTHKSVRTAGNKIDEAIQDHLKKRHNLIIGDTSAENIKIKIGSATKLEKSEKMEISGRDLVFGLPRSVTLTSTEITEAIRGPIMTIVGAVKGVLEDTPPELASDIIDKGIVMSGGTSLLRNLDKLLTEETGVPAHVAEDALLCVVKGTGVVMENIDLWKRSILTRR